MSATGRIRVALMSEALKLVGRSDGLFDNRSKDSAAAARRIGLLS